MKSLLVQFFGMGRGSFVYLHCFYAFPGLQDGYLQYLYGSSSCQGGHSSPSTQGWQKCNIILLVPHVHSTSFTQVLAFLEHDVELCQPDKIHICDGSDEEFKELLQLLVDEKIAVPLPKMENWYKYIMSTLRNDSVGFQCECSYLAHTDPRDVARVESKTLICTPEKREAVPIPKPGVTGQLGNWISSEQLYAMMKERFPGCMKGRIMYVMAYR